MTNEQITLIFQIRCELEQIKDAFPYSYHRIQEHLEALEKSLQGNCGNPPDISAEALDEDMEAWRSAQKYR